MNWHYHGYKTLYLYRKELGWWRSSVYRKGEDAFKVCEAVLKTPFASPQIRDAATAFLDGRSVEHPTKPAMP